MDFEDWCLQSMSIAEYLPDEIKRYKHVLEVRNWSETFEDVKDVMNRPFHIKSNVFDIKSREFDASWRLFFYPNGTEFVGAEYGYLAAYLCMESHEIFGMKDVNVMLKFKLMDSKGRVIVDECPEVNDFVRVNDDGGELHDLPYDVDVHKDYIMRKDDKRFLMYKNERDCWGVTKLVSHSYLDNVHLDDDRIFLAVELIFDEQITSNTGAMKMNAFRKENRLSSEIKDLFLNEKFTDFEILCENEVFKCHKIILAARSPVFDAMLTHNMVENKQSRVEINDLDVSTVNDMISYIYSGKVANLDGNAKNLLAAAENYQLVDLKHMCLKSLAKNIDSDDGIEALITSEIYNVPVLKSLALSYIKQHGMYSSGKRQWVKKLQDYPELIADIFEVLASSKCISCL